MTWKALTLGIIALFAEGPAYADKQPTIEDVNSVTGFYSSAVNGPLDLVNAKYDFGTVKINPSTLQAEEVAITPIEGLYYSPPPACTFPLYGPQGHQLNYASYCWWKSTSPKYHLCL